MEKHHKFSIWYVLFAVWIALILQNVIVHFFSVERVPYSKFIKAPGSRQGDGSGGDAGSPPR